MEHPLRKAAITFGFLALCCFTIERLFCFGKLDFSFLGGLINGIKLCFFLFFIAQMALLGIEFAKTPEKHQEGWALIFMFVTSLCFAAAIPLYHVITLLCNTFAYVADKLLP